jgi:hypothetical protein
VLSRTRQERLRCGSVPVRRHSEALRSRVPRGHAVLLSGCGATPGVRAERAAARRGLLQVASGRRDEIALLGRHWVTNRRILFGSGFARAGVPVGFRGGRRRLRAGSRDCSKPAARRPESLAWYELVAGAFSINPQVESRAQGARIASQVMRARHMRGNRGIWRSTRRG